MQGESRWAKLSKLISLSFFILKNYLNLFFSPQRARIFFTNLYVLKLLPGELSVEGKTPQAKAQALIQEAKDQAQRIQQEAAERSQRLAQEEKGRQERLQKEESFYQKKRQAQAVLHQRYLAEKKQGLSLGQGQWVTLTLRNDQDELWELHLQVLSHPLAQEWFARLQKDLQNPQLHLEKGFSFLGFSRPHRSLEKLCQELNHFIKIINQSGQYALDLHFDLPKLQTHSQDLLNELHHHFETLIGQVENISPYFHQASPNTRYAIKQINQLCHEIEYSLRAQEKAQSKEAGPDEVSASLQVCFLKTAVRPLSLAEKNQLSLERDFGQVYLHYCQLGKTHQEAYWDQDQRVGDHNISELNYLSSQFDIDFGPPTLTSLSPELEAHWKDDEKASFERWLKAQGKKDLPMGRLVVGTMPWGQFPTPYLSQIQERLGQFSDLYQISLQEDGRLLTLPRVFPYKDSDPGYSERELQLFRESTYEI